MAGVGVSLESRLQSQYSRDAEDPRPTPRQVAPGHNRGRHNDLDSFTPSAQIWQDMPCIMPPAFDSSDPVAAQKLALAVRSALRGVSACGGATAEPADDAGGPDGRTRAEARVRARLEGTGSALAMSGSRDSPLSIRNDPNVQSSQIVFDGAAHSTGKAGEDSDSAEVEGDVLDESGHGIVSDRISRDTMARFSRSRAAVWELPDPTLGSQKRRQHAERSLRSIDGGAAGSRERVQVPPVLVSASAPPSIPGGSDSAGTLPAPWQPYGNMPRICGYFEVTIGTKADITKCGGNYDAEQADRVASGGGTFAGGADEGVCVAVGLTKTSGPLQHQMPGWNRSSVGYHGDDGNKFHASGLGQPFGPRFGAGDTVGCGVDYGACLPVSGAPAAGSSGS